MRNYKNTLRLKKGKNNAGVRVTGHIHMLIEIPSKDESVKFYWIS